MKKFFITDNYSLCLSVFRIFACFIALRNLVVSVEYFDELFGATSFLVTPDYLYGIPSIDVFASLIRSNAYWIICLYAMILIMYMFGIGRRYTAIVAFLLLDLVQRMTHITLNGGDNLLKFAFLYLCFADSFRYLVIEKKVYTDEAKERFSNFLNNLAVSSVQVHLCLVYFLSTIYKLNTEIWFNGVATYYTFSLERFQGTVFNEVLAKNGFFVTIATYTTLIVELSFPYLIWFKQTKWFITIATIMLHMGIFVFMMIYDFQIIFIAMHLFFYRNIEMKLALKRLKGYFNRLLSILPKKAQISLQQIIQS